METVEDRQRRETLELQQRHKRECREIEERHQREVREVQERHQRELGPKRRRVPTPATQNVRNPRIYVLGGKAGSNAFSQVERYDANTDSWTEVESLQSKRSRLAAAVVGAQLYAIGGYDFRTSPVSSVERFDTVSNEWCSAPQMSTERADLAVAVHGKKKSMRWVAWTRTMTRWLPSNSLIPHRTLGNLQHP